VKGIEPSYSAWKAAALPLSYTRARGQICNGPGLFATGRSSTAVAASRRRRVSIRIRSPKPRAFHTVAPLATVQPVQVPDYRRLAIYNETIDRVFKPAGPFSLTSADPVPINRPPQAMRGSPCAPGRFDTLAAMAPGECPEWQRELTVNQPPHGFAGSSPASPTSLRSLRELRLGKPSAAFRRAGPTSHDSAGQPPLIAT
jgi:hypothetical protein